MKKKIKLILIILIIFLICGIYLFYENTTIQITNYSISNIKVPDDFYDYRIIQISDFHNTTSQKLTNALINTIKEQKPNIIVLTGDLIDSRNTKIDITINFIKEIIDVAPVYYVTGNHEARIDKYNEFKEEMSNLGVNILENKVEILKQNDSEINLIGINDPNFSREFAITDSEVIQTEIEKLEYDKEGYTILLSHRPEVFETYVSENIDLIFTGHAHGGQIRIPFVGGIIAPNQGLFPKYTSGKYEKNDTTMIVNRGIGNSLFPFRINNRPELVIVDLKSEQ